MEHAVIESMYSETIDDQHLYNSTSIQECLTVAMHEYDVERNKKQSLDNRASLIVTLFSGIIIAIYNKLPIDAFITLVNQQLTFLVLTKILLILGTYVALFLSLYSAIKIIIVASYDNFDIKLLDTDFISSPKIDSVPMLLKTYLILTDRHRAYNEDSATNLYRSQCSMLAAVFMIFIYLILK